MWGVMGIVYNPSEVAEEDVKHWSMLLDSRYYKRITMKDSIRESYIVALGIWQEKELLQPSFLQAASYHDKLTERLNDTSEAAVNAVETILDRMRDNAYSLETDSGKADMVTGKVVANMQWSGDGVYTMDQAEEDGIRLSYAVPEEGSNLWFDGWCMLRQGIDGDAKKKQAAEAFINYVSRPDNVIRNMYYVGYTSVIAGGDSDLVYQYADWCYGAEEDEEDTAEYSLDYFFAASDEEQKEGEYTLEVPSDQVKRQIYAQYPTEDVLRRSAVMACFDDEANKRISQMWINIRCWHWNVDIR
jgi:spermidine/putrescine transport system substrate-binding protein